MKKRVAFLSTGSELIAGEILNTNVQAMAQQLAAAGVQLGEQLATDDTEAHIAEALSFLSPRHEAIILTGGLGPTSDDRTRFALSRHLNLPLVFSESSWQKILARFARRNLIPTENNRTQAMFPQFTEVLSNPNGSADAAQIFHQEKLFFMLPGPPNECLPLFRENVFPALEAQGFFTETRLYRWILFQVSESQLAAKLDPLAEKLGFEIGYRLIRPPSMTLESSQLAPPPLPEIHVKVLIKPEDPIQHWIELIEKELQSYPFTRDFPR